MQIYRGHISKIQSFSRVWLWEPMDCSMPGSLSIINSWSLLKLMSVEVVVQSHPLILCCPLLPMPSVYSRIRVFSNESVLRIRWPKHRSSSFSIRSSNEYSGLISFRIDWFDLLAVQRTLKSLLQHHNLKASFFNSQSSLWSNSYSDHDSWKDHSFDYMNFCQQSDSAF